HQRGDLAFEYVQVCLSTDRVACEIERQRWRAHIGDGFSDADLYGQPRLAYPLNGAGDVVGIEAGPGWNCVGLAAWFAGARRLSAQRDGRRSRPAWRAQCDLD